MKEFVMLVCSIVVNVLLSKGIALGLVLLLFWIKGKQLKFNSERWEDYFLELSQRKLIRIALSISGIAIVVSAFFSYIILEKAGVRYAFMIAAIILCCSILWFWHKWRGDKGKVYILKRFAEIPQTILEKREQEALN